MTPPILGEDERGDETATFTSGHSWADVARWVVGHSITDAEELHRILGEMIDNKDGEGEKQKGAKQIMEETMAEFYRLHVDGLLDMSPIFGPGPLVKIVYDEKA